MKRRLAAILVADVAGHGSLLGADEEGTAARMAACRAIPDAEIAQADGRLLEEMGHAVLAEFTCPMHAVRCGVGSIQQNELYRGRKLSRLLIERLVEAGLPRLTAVAQAS